MIINGSNKVVGFYNYSSTPPNTMFTEGDLVLHNNTIFTCVFDTDSEPNPNSLFWRYYLQGMKTVDDYSEFNDPNLDNSLVSLAGLKDFIQNNWAGVNHNGTLKVLHDSYEVPLDTLTKNSSFQLATNYLNAISDTLPFVPTDSRVYVVRTTGDINSGSTDDPSIFVQEIIEYSSNGNYYSWVRSGVSLESATWKPTKGESFNYAYISYLDNVISRYNQGKSLYDNFMVDVTLGEYKYWRGVPVVQENIIFDGGTFKQDKFYKIIFHTKGSSKTSFSIDITPEDHMLESGETISYTSSDEVVLKSVITNTELEIDFTKLTLVAIRESTNIEL